MHVSTITSTGPVLQSDITGCEHDKMYVRRTHIFFPCRMQSASNTREALHEQ